VSDDHGDRWRGPANDASEMSSNDEARWAQAGASKRDYRPVIIERNEIDPKWERAGARPVKSSRASTNLNLSGLAWRQPGCSIGAGNDHRVCR